MFTSVSMCMPPAGSSDGRLKLLIETPGRLLNPLNAIVLLRDTLSNIVPKAVMLRFCVDKVHSKPGLCSRKVAKDVNLHKLSIWQVW